MYLLAYNYIKGHVTNVMHAGAPLLYMVLCVPLGFALPRLENSYGYEIVGQNGTTTLV